MPILYPRKPRHIGDDILMVRVHADTVRLTHDALWQAFFQGYMGATVPVPVTFLRDMYAWFGHTSRLRNLLYMTPLETPTALTTEFVSSVAPILAAMPPVAAIPAWQHAGYEEAVTALYPGIDDADMHKLIRLLDLLTPAHERLGKQEWRVDMLGVIQNPRYREVLYHLGVYARLAL